MRDIMIFALGVLAFLMLSSPGFAIDYSKNIRSVVNNTVRIEVEYGDEWEFVGTGTVIKRYPWYYLGQDSRYGVLTVNHVMEDNGGLAMRACASVDHSKCFPLPKERYYGGDYWDFLAIQDWAIIPLTEAPKGFKPFVVTPSRGKAGDSISIVANPMGRFIVADGNIGSVNEDGTITVVSYAAGGSSGGLVVDKRGRTLGLVRGIYLSDDGMETSLVSLVPIEVVGL